MNDPLLRMLSALPSVDPDAERSERLRMRSRTTVGRRSPRPRQRAGTQRWVPLVALLGGVYLVEVMREAIRLAGLANGHF